MKTWGRAIQLVPRSSRERELVLPTTERRLLWLESSPRRSQWGGQGPDCVGPGGHSHEQWEAISRFYLGKG